jgi:hypothetical protein
MNRRHFISGTSASLVTAAVSYVAFVQPGDEQIAALATQVADLDARVDALETQVAAIGGEGVTGRAAEPTPDTGTENVVIEGVGTMVSDPFRLATGRYRVNVAVQANNGFASIIVEVFDPSGASELVVNQFGDSAGEWTGSVMYDAPTDGDYFISVSNTNTPWSVAFEPF